jgi:hypothetical protein
MVLISIYSHGTFPPLKIPQNVQPYHGGILTGNTGHVPSGPALQGGHIDCVRHSHTDIILRCKQLQVICLTEKICESPPN